VECTNTFACLAKEDPENPSLLHPVVMSLLVEYCRSSPHIISRLARTCKAYANAFPYSANMLRMGDWLAGFDYYSFNQQQATSVKQELSLRMVRTTPKPCREGNSWEIVLLSRRAEHSFYHSGVAHLHPRSLSLWISSEDSQSRGGLGVCLDVFHHIHSVEGLKACIHLHLSTCSPKTREKPQITLDIKHQHWFCRNYPVLLRRLQPHWDDDSPESLQRFLVHRFALASSCP
jgi:hypothetical protein